MKKIILYTVLFAIPGLLFAQSTDNYTPPIKTDYLKKSKNQKTVAWSLLGGGFALFITAAASASPADNGEEILPGLVVDTTPEEINYSTGEAVLLATGTAAMLASIPFFIAAKKNKEKARNMTTGIKMEKATIFQKQSFVQSTYPALTFKINL